jgi:hypothetical protein
MRQMAVFLCRRDSDTNSQDLTIASRGVLTSAAAFQLSPKACTVEPSGRSLSNPNYHVLRCHIGEISQRLTRLSRERGNPVAGYCKLGLDTRFRGYDGGELKESAQSNQKTRTPSAC